MREREREKLREIGMYINITYCVSILCKYTLYISALHLLNDASCSIVNRVSNALSCVVLLG